MGLVLITIATLLYFHAVPSQAQNGVESAGKAVITNKPVIAARQISDGLDPQFLGYFSYPDTNECILDPLSSTSAALIGRREKSSAKRRHQQTRDGTASQA